jgi:hypothetical protein
VTLLTRQQAEPLTITDPAQDTMLTIRFNFQLH